MTPTLPHHNGDPAHTGSQYLEDLACSSWYSEVLFTALELDLFSLLAPGVDDLAAFARDHGFEADGMIRLLTTLKTLALVEFENGFWFNSAAASRHLVRGSEQCLIDFLLYRRYIQEGWRQLADKIAPQRIKNDLDTDADYKQRNFYYVRALDQLARHKAKEIVELVSSVTWRGAILDIGGGAGAVSRAFLAERPGSTATLFEIPEVVDAAKQIYPTDSGQQLETASGDFRDYDFGPARYGLIILANFLHAYDGPTAQELLVKACSLLDHNGVLLIHDYFPDRCPGGVAGKGALYDLHMLANTYNGGCQPSGQIVSWLEDENLAHIRVCDLASDSSIIVASQQALPDFGVNWPQLARETGFRNGVEINPKQVMTAPWVRSKCECGCEEYGQNLQCPPHSRNHKETVELLASYTKALLVEGTPPGIDFHQHLLDLERQAFLMGYPKALALGAGPCPVCPTCNTDETCRFPDKARPSMEASGIDVYGTAQAAGISLTPLTDKDQYVKYIGLLLIS